MTARLCRRAAPLALALALAPSCTLIAVDSEDGPPGLRADGLIEGHAAVGVRDEDQVLYARLFGGSSPGALGELVLWRLARLEVGLAGVAVGLGPFDLALGTLFYDPELPRFVEDEAEGCERCAEALGE
jgi:hypothetical protein